ncbi:MAG: hydrolase family protein [Mucilaginibacter sp.]|nr:hydrolase family protein [Mucilaginibacter sp.]
MQLRKLNLLLLFTICCVGCKKYVDNDNLPPKVPPTIIILGSSTAAGIGASPIDSAWAYRLQSAVNKTQEKARFINLAYSGYTLYQAMPNGYQVTGRPLPDTARNITKALSYHPNMIMISFPTNDIASYYSDDEIINNYAKLTHMLDSAKVAYIIFSTQPRSFTDINQSMRLKSVNDKIKSLYTTHYNDFLDQLSTSTYSIKPLYSAGDGIHLNNAGHWVIFNATLNHPILIKVLQ